MPPQGQGYCTRIEKRRTDVTDNLKHRWHDKRRCKTTYGRSIRLHRWLPSHSRSGVRSPQALPFSPSRQRFSISAKHLNLRPPRPVHLDVWPTGSRGAGNCYGVLPQRRKLWHYRQSLRHQCRYRGETLAMRWIIIGAAMAAATPALAADFSSRWDAPRPALTTAGIGSLTCQTFAEWYRDAPRGFDNALPKNLPLHVFCRQPSVRTRARPCRPSATLRAFPCLSKAKLLKRATRRVRLCYGRGDEFHQHLSSPKRWRACDGSGFANCESWGPCFS
jgi:hypothetical protein